MLRDALWIALILTGVGSCSEHATHDERDDGGADLRFPVPPDASDAPVADTYGVQDAVINDAFVELRDDLESDPDMPFGGIESCASPVTIATAT